MIIMENLLYLVTFPIVVALTVSVELLFNKSLRRRALEIDENAEELINGDVANAFESAQVVRDGEVAFRMHGENTNVFNRAA